MKVFALTAVCILMLSAASFAQVKSVYTSTNTKACRTISSNPDEAGSYEGECRGVGGYKVRLLEGDLRQSITLVTPKKKKQELNFWQQYSGFSSIGEKIEWRVKKGVPIALIARYNVASGDDSTKNTAYLLVSKISATGSCVTDVVQPSTSQNAEARRLADIASTKPCREPGN
jgi:hypothetical protein